MVPEASALDGTEHPLVTKAFQRFQHEHTRWNRWTSLWQEAYDYALPQRDKFYQSGQMGGTGDRRGAELYDMTAVVSVSEFASRLSAGVMPAFVRWVDLVPGSKTDPIQRDRIAKELESATETIFEILRDSNLDSQIHECFLDLAVGHATLLIEEGIDKPIEFLAVPMTHNIWGMGPKGQPDGNFRPEMLTGEALLTRYPRARQNADLASKLEGMPHTEIEIIHATWRDWGVREDEVNHYVCFERGTKAVLDMYQYEGDGSYPYVNFRWSKAAGELYGRGPLMSALPTVKTVNLIVRDMLDAAELATVGMYQVDDDGVVNPSTIKVAPGAIIPVAPGSRGLQPVQAPSNIRWSEFLMEQLRLDIKRALYDEMLGPPEGTPMSATEVRERQADMARRIGSPFSRLQVELVQPLLKRVIHILKGQGQISIPQINGREVKIVAVSPLARAQEQESVRNIYAWLEMLMTHYGPDVAAAVSIPSEVGEHSAIKMGVPPKVLRPAKQAEQILAQMRQPQQGQPA